MFVVGCLAFLLVYNPETCRTDGVENEEEKKNIGRCFLLHLKYGQSTSASDLTEALLRHNERRIRTYVASRGGFVLFSLGSHREKLGATRPETCDSTWNLAPFVAVA